MSTIRLDITQVIFLFQGASNGRLFKMSSRKQEGLVRKTGLRSRLGRMQPFLSLLLHVLVGEAEQQMSFVSARVVHTTYGKVVKFRNRCCPTSPQC